MSTLAFGRKYGLDGRNGIGHGSSECLVMIHGNSKCLRAHALREFLLKEEEQLNQRFLDENLSEVKMD